jgi:neutral amino acid transport system permease protein
VRIDGERAHPARRAHPGILRGALSAIVLATALLAAAPAGAQEGGESFVGTFQDPDREPVEGVRVEVRRDGEVVGEAVSDGEGNWSVAVPGPGPYDIEVDVATLPDETPLRDPDRAVLTQVEVREGQAKRVLFQLGERARGGISDTEKLATLAFDGLRVGLVLALMSVGLSLIFGVTGLTNFAHGELVTFGALMAFLFASSGVSSSVPLVAAAGIATVAGAGFGLAHERLLFRPLRRRRTGNVSLIVVTIGLGLALRHLYLLLFGERPRPYDEFTIQRAVDLPLISPRPKDLVVMGLAAVAILAYGYLMQRTRLGMATRAVADSPDLAAASGIDVQRVIQSTWVLAGALAALGGVFWGVTETLQWDMGFTLLLLMFATVILGGVGTAYGPLVGGVVIGVAAQVSTFWITSSLRIGVALAVLIVVILVRPQGILGRRERIG